MTSEAIANFCGVQSTIKSMKSLVSKTLWHCLNVETENKKDSPACTYGHGPVQWALLLGLLEHTGQALELVSFARTTVGKRADACLRPKYKPEPRQM